LKQRFPDLFLLDAIEEGDKSVSLPDLKHSYPIEVEKVEKAVHATMDYMTQFRADSIVQDAEEVKDVLLQPTEDNVRL
jgi:hypothetical protein